MEYEGRQLHFLWLDVFGVSPAFAEEKYIRRRRRRRRKLTDTLWQISQRCASAVEPFCVSGGPLRGHCNNPSGRNQLVFRQGWFALQGWEYKRNSGTYVMFSTLECILIKCNNGYLLSGFIFPRIFILVRSINLSCTHIWCKPK